MSRTGKKIPVLQRVFRRTIIPINKDGTQSKSKCWTWTGPTNNAGYGLIKVSQELNMASVHRVVMIEYHKIINYGDKVEVLHTCGNKLCVNPDHLKIGNVIDRHVLQKKYDAYNKAFRDKIYMNPVCEHCGQSTYRPWFKRKHRLCKQKSKHKYNTQSISEINR